jgi:glycine C-acetyltransferase
MLRLIPTAEHTLEDVDYTVNAFRKIKAKVDNKEYSDELVDFNF